MDLAYIREGMVPAQKVDSDKVRVEVDSICHTIVNGRVTTALMEEVRYNQWYGRKVLVNLQNLFVTIRVEAAVI